MQASDLRWKSSGVFTIRHITRNRHRLLYKAFLLCYSYQLCRKLFVREWMIGTSSRRRWMKDTKRCTLCILPSSYPGIEFDHKGVCSYCHAEMRNRPLLKHKKDKADLDKIVLAHKGKNPKYDAVVGLSGGKDSTYVAYYLKKEYGLKILGFNYDIGYRSSYAIRNLETVADKLDMDIITIRPKKSFLMRLFAQRITQIAQDLLCFFPARHDLTTNRTIRISGIDQR